jgi:ribosomal protein L32E
LAAIKNESAAKKAEIAKLKMSFKNKFNFDLKNMMKMRRRLCDIWRKHHGKQGTAREQAQLPHHPQRALSAYY